MLVSVERDTKYASNEKMVSRFIKLSKKERIREEFRERCAFKSKSQKRREKSDRARRRRAREETKRQQDKEQAARTRGQR